MLRLTSRLRSALPTAGRRLLVTETDAERRFNRSLNGKHVLYFDVNETMLDPAPVRVMIHC